MSKISVLILAFKHIPLKLLSIFMNCYYIRKHEPREAALKLLQSYYVFQL